MKSWKERMAEVYRQIQDEIIAELMPIVSPQGYTKPGQRGVDKDWESVWVQIESETDKLHISYEYSDEWFTVHVCNLKDDGQYIDEIKELVFQESWKKVLKKLQDIKVPCPHCEGTGEIYDEEAEDYIECEHCDENGEISKRALLKAA